MKKSPAERNTRMNSGILFLSVSWAERSGNLKAGDILFFSSIEESIVFCLQTCLNLVIRADFVEITDEKGVNVRCTETCNSQSIAAQIQIAGVIDMMVIVKVRLDCLIGAPLG